MGRRLQSDRKEKGFSFIDNSGSSLFWEPPKDKNKCNDTEQINQSNSKSMIMQDSKILIRSAELTITLSHAE